MPTEQNKAVLRRWLEAWNTGSVSAMEALVDETFAADSSEMFKTSDLDREDAESHYSLGLAYKEMGLYEEAIGEFEVASNSPARRIDSLLLQGLCHSDNGDLSEAKKILTSLLQESSISEIELLSAKYELATCHEISGETEAPAALHGNSHHQPRIQ